MKKTLLALAVVFSCTALSAQTNAEERVKGTLTKSGRQILPKAGDFSIGIDATPMFRYLGNFLNHSTDNSANGFFNGPDNNQTIFMKYFIKDDAALRARLHLGFSSDKRITDVPKFSTKETTDLVDNSEKQSRNGFDLDLGYEIRRGYGRLQGFFGPQVGLGFGGKSISYSYGNALSEKNSMGGSERILSSSKGYFQFGLGAFAGVEYFILPKVSIAGEVNCNLGIISNGKNKVSSEKWDVKEDEHVVKNVKTGSGGSAFNFATAYTGTLSVNFYF